MAPFDDALRNSKRFPESLIHHESSEQSLTKYSERLRVHQHRLFCGDGEAEIDLWDFTRGDDRFRPKTVATLNQLEEKLCEPLTAGLKEPQCRFVFLEAPHSRAPLNSTLDMFTYLMTYLQVMPSYLDFMYPFGQQVKQQDFHFSGFYYENRLRDQDRGLEIDTLGRSGYSFQICYNLKSVESTGDSRMPWSIRQTAAYHAFDVKSGHTTWVITKGNSEVSDRIMDATELGAKSNLNSYENESMSFASSLETHILICDWAAESWRWYINYLEDELQDSVTRTLSSNVNYFKPVRFKKPSRAAILHPNLPQTSSEGSGSSKSILKSLKHSLKPGRQETKHIPSLQQPSQVVTSATAEPMDPDEYSISDLQNVQYIEEKANAALLVLKSNGSILSHIQRYYQSIQHVSGFPDALRLACETSLMKFEKRIAQVISDLEMQQSRLETLLRMTEGTKSLLYGIIDYRNMRTNRVLAEKTHFSTEQMNILTQEMHIIARRTERETVVMRILTVVALIFLPGTFICTLMSTDVLKFTTSESGVSTKTWSLTAVKWFFWLTLPLMLATGCFAGGFYWWLKRKNTRKEQKLDEEQENGTFSS